MSSSTKSKRKKTGRPALPKAARAARRVTVRIYADDEALLAALCGELGANEGEVVRRALRALAQAEGVKK